MKESTVTTSIYLDKRRVKKDGTYPVKLRLTFRRKSRLYKTNYSLSIEDFDKVISKKPRGIFKEYKMSLTTIEQNAINIIQKLPVFSFKSFEKRYLRNNFDAKNVFSYFEEKIDELKNFQSYRTADIYQCALNSLRAFNVNTKLAGSEVNVEFLRRYELWMTENNRSSTTISMYLRCLRHIYNRMSEENNFDTKLYPFQKSKFKIPHPKNIKKALKIDELKLLYEYQAEKGSKEEFYQDLWFFSYLCNGINMKDICYLKHKDIQGNHIYFRREKTKNTNRSSLPVDVALIDDIKLILEKWGTQSINNNDFVFPFLRHNMSEVEKIARVKFETKQTNKYINRIAQKVGIEKRVTTYTARHSYASILNRLGVNGSFIQEQLGHKNLSTTESYLDSIENDTKREIANKLLNFNEK